ncbi:hypothetical protein [Rhodopirellula bahusiensis]|uniref:Apea-like HEPN domain-containing protein n=1 Tax=Rhodopirellula bahusiensis TaxID=2014065 RepID=A0A2G1W6C5_9BACT|nr:hypothetical protein [Rhodopirellula bahusiensis]PHQ34585.1 hypothetical protein CEE69_14315 [Rhodopirellula bahusiensis]
MIPVSPHLNDWLSRQKVWPIRTLLDCVHNIPHESVDAFAKSLFTQTFVFVRDSNSGAHFQLCGPILDEAFIASSESDYLSFATIEAELGTREQYAIEEIARRVWSEVYTPLSHFGCIADGIDRGNINQNDATTLNAIESLSELEECDSRLTVVVAAARIDKALMEMVELYGRDLKRMPAKFMTRTKAAHREALIDDRLLSFASKLRTLRNQIVHADTRQDCMVSGRLARQTEQLCQLSAGVPVWGPCEPMEPQRRFSRRIYAAMLSGVLAFELTFFDDAENVRTKSFELVRDYVFDRPVIAKVEE